VTTSKRQKVQRLLKLFGGDHEIVTVQQFNCVVGDTVRRQIFAVVDGLLQPWTV